MISSLGEQGKNQHQEHLEAIQSVEKKLDTLIDAKIKANNTNIFKTMCSFLNDLRNITFNNTIDFINFSNKFGLHNGLLTDQTIFVPTQAQKAIIAQQQPNKNAINKYAHFPLNTNQNE